MKGRRGRKEGSRKGKESGGGRGRVLPPVLRGDHRPCSREVL